MHFHALKRNAGANFIKWCTKRYEDLKRQLEADEEAVDDGSTTYYGKTEENLRNKLKKTADGIKDKFKAWEQVISEQFLADHADVFFSRQELADPKEKAKKIKELKGKKWYALFLERIAWYRTQQKISDLRSELAALKPFIHLKESYEHVMKRGCAGAQEKAMLTQGKKEIMIDETKHEEELVGWIRQMRTRVKMKENYQCDPILETFDMLQLQEFSLH